MHMTFPDAGFLPILDFILKKELEEFLDTQEPGELADLVEMNRRVVELRGLSWDDPEEIPKKRAEERCGFKENMVLVTRDGGTGAKEASVHLPEGRPRV